MSKHPFRGPLIKVDRANKLVHQLASIDDAFWKSCAPFMVIEENSETGDRQALIKSTQEIPDIVQPIIGEIIYHFRSCLDQIAVALARMSAAKPNPKNIYFPSGDCLKGFTKSCDSNTKGLDADFIKIIKNLKPYDGENDMLRSIFPLANVDKHMELIPAGSVGTPTFFSGFKVFSDSAHGPAMVMSSGPQSLADGILIANLGPTGTIKPMHPNGGGQIKVSGHIAFGDVPFHKGKPIVSTLDNLGSITNNVLHMLIEHCKRTGRIN